MKMTIDNGIRVLAGVLTLTSLVLGWIISPWWLLLAGFVNLNMIQSAFSGFCPPGKLMAKAGFRQTVPVDSGETPGGSRVPGQLLIGIVVGVLLTGALVWAVMPRLMLVEYTSRFPTVEETVTQLQTAIKEGGWTSPSTMNMNASMAKHGVDMDRPVQVVNLCKPAHAEKVLMANPEISTLMPCSWGVYKADDGSVRISTMNMKLMGKMFGGTVAEVMGGSVAGEEHLMLDEIVQP